MQESGFEIKGPGVEECNACGVCTLSCPVWQQTKDFMRTFAGRARALQAGAEVRDIEASLTACILCGACGPACTRGIDTVGITLGLRARLAEKQGSKLASMAVGLDDAASAGASFKSSRVFLPGPGLRGHGSLYDSALDVLKGLGPLDVAEDDGPDVSAALEAGVLPEDGRLKGFIQYISAARELIIADGLMNIFLRRALPETKVRSIGEALLDIPSVLSGITGTDLYIVESRAYHAEYTRLAEFYDNVRKKTGCQMNIDLYRTATATAGTSIQVRCRLADCEVSSHEQARWIIKGRSPHRILAESVEDMAPLREASDVPVIHVSELLQGNGRS
jgi:ferredoxin